jgi:hypothetical protein
MSAYDARRVAGSVLTRLVRFIRQSPLMYLADSGVWTYRGSESLKLTLADVIDEQRGIIDRAEAILVAEQLELPLTAFPLAYTGWHDVDLGFLLTHVIDNLVMQQVEFESLLGEADVAAAHGGGGTGRAAELVREARAAISLQIDTLRQQASHLSSRASVAAD